MGVNSFCEIQQCGCEEYLNEKSMSMQVVNVVSYNKGSNVKENEYDGCNVDVIEKDNEDVHVNKVYNIKRGIKILGKVIKEKVIFEWKVFFKEMKLLKYIHNLKRIQPVYHNVSTKTTEEITITSTNNANGNNNTHLQLFNYYKQYNSVYLGMKMKQKGKDGFGIEKWNNHSSIHKIAQYIGLYNNNIANGYGRFTTYNENEIQISSYCGEIVNSYANGFGVYVNDIKNIKTYGMWSNDKLHLIGIEEWKDGSLYEGEFQNGNKNGIGVYKWNNGSIYSGNWKNNTINGYGIYKNNNETNSYKYIGEWVNNKKEGLGLYLTLSYKHYGLYRNDKRNGFGVMLWEGNNKAYVGFWKEGSKDGIGKFITNEKNVYGVWNEGGEKGKKRIEHINVDMFYVLLDHMGFGCYKNMFKFSLQEVVQFMKEILIC